jgi:hypothetical protein
VALERWLIVLGIVLFGGSLLMPAIEGSGFPAFSGLDVLRQGASGWREGVVAWYANPVLVVAFACCWFKRYRLALGAGAAGLVLALSSFAAGPAAQLAGRSVPPFHFAIGFYVWLLALLAGALAPVAGIYKVSIGR